MNENPQIVELDFDPEEIQVRRGLLSPSRDRRRSPEPKQNRLTELRDEHLEILRLKARGLKNTEIAKLTNRTPMSISMVVNDPLCRREMEKIHKQRGRAVLESLSELETLAPLAVDAYRRVLEGDVEASPMQQVKVAGEVLDRAGAGRMQRLETSSVSYQLTGAEIEEIKKRALENRSRSIDCAVLEESPPPPEPEPAAWDSSFGEQLELSGLEPEEVEGDVSDETDETESILG